MYKKLIYSTLPLFLTGCIGSFISGHEGYDQPYPDIRKVPERKEALTTRGLHEREETISREGELKKLKQDWEQITARNEALREEAFSTQGVPLEPPTPLDGKDAP